MWSLRCCAGNLKESVAWGNALRCVSFARPWNCDVVSEPVKP